jgi:Domain of unknown function (DUF4404)
MTPEPSQPPSPGVSETQDRLQDVARMLRQSSSIDPQSRQALAELVDELSKALQEQNVPPAEVARLAENTAHLAESLHHQRERSMLGAAREGLEQAAVEAEAHAPLLVGLARKVVDVLAGFGI